MKLKNTITAGLSALTLESYACSIPIPEYKEAGTYNCEKYGDRISAKNGNQVAIKDNYDRTFMKIEYSKNMSMEQAIKAIGACEKAFAIKTEKEEQ